MNKFGHNPLIENKKSRIKKYSRKKFTGNYEFSVNEVKPVNIVENRFSLAHIHECVQESIIA